MDAKQRFLQFPPHQPHLSPISPNIKYLIKFSGSPPHQPLLSALSRNIKDETAATTI